MISGSPSPSRSASAGVPKLMGWPSTLNTPFVDGRAEVDGLAQHLEHALRRRVRVAVHPLLTVRAHDVEVVAVRTERHLHLAVAVQVADRRARPDRVDDLEREPGTQLAGLVDRKS